MSCRVKNDWWWNHHRVLYTQSHSIFSTHYQSVRDMAVSCVGAYQSKRDAVTAFRPLEILGWGGAHRKLWACFHESQQPKIASVWPWSSWVSAAALKLLREKSEVPRTLCLPGHISQPRALGAILWNFQPSTTDLNSAVIVTDLSLRFYVLYSQEESPERESYIHHKVWDTRKHILSSGCKV